MRSIPHVKTQRNANKRNATQSNANKRNTTQINATQRKKLSNLKSVRIVGKIRKK